MENETIVIQRLVKKEEEGLYFPVEFTVPDQVEKLEITYTFPRFQEKKDADGQIHRIEKNIIDMSLCGAKGVYLGSSGADRSCIMISSYGSSQGYASVEIDTGTWQIILGAYKIQDQGCPVEYTITFYKKNLRLYKGDTHLHTTGSDGNCSLEEIAQLAMKRGLNYVFVTDHNNYAHNEQLPQSESLTMIPGAEWTHYKGHAGLLGVKKPFENPFCVNSPDEMREKIDQAGKRGAVRVIHHPFCPNCGWRWGMDAVEYDAVEIWNGGNDPSVNRKCLDWWDKQLKNGKRISITGGSDFHRAEYGSILGTPCTCLYAMSRTATDLTNALKKGHGFIVYDPSGPMAYGQSGKALFGDAIDSKSLIHLRFWNLRSGDQILLITDQKQEKISVSDNICEINLERKAEGIRYLRAEVYRDSVFAGAMPVLITNPFYVYR